MVERLAVDESTGQLQIHVRNAGAGTWPAHTLEVAVTRPSGGGVGAYSWPDFFLPPGGRSILQHPDLEPERPMDVCLLLDPGNQVPEEDDRMEGVWRRPPYCPDLPDLTITGVRYDQEEQQLPVTVENVGVGTVAEWGVLEHRNLGLRIELPDGTSFDAPAEWWSDVSMDTWDTLVLAWSNIRSEHREMMVDGYTLVIDPNDDIAEADEENNTHEVGPAASLRVAWLFADAPYHFRDNAQYDFDIYAVSGGSRRTIAAWRIGPEIDWGSCFEDSHCILMLTRSDYDTHWFDVAGDEELEIQITVSNPGTLTPSVTNTRRYGGPYNDWGAGGPAADLGCSDPAREIGDGRHYWEFGSYGGEPWDVHFNICNQDS